MMQRFRSLLYLLLGVSSPLLILAKPEVPVGYTDVLMARDFEYFDAFPGRAAPRDLSKRQTPEEVCGVGYVLCDTTHCCQKGTYCELRTLGWYCPVIGGSSAVPTLTVDGPTITTIIWDTPTETSDTSPTDSTVEFPTGGAKKKKGGVGKGAVIGIVVAVVVILIIAAVVAFFVIRSKKKKQKEATGPPIQSIMQQQYTPPPPPQVFVQPQQQQQQQQQHGINPQGYYPPQGQYPPQEQYPQYPQGQYPQAPPSPAPQYSQPYPQYGYTAPPVVDNVVKEPTPGAGYYQPGHNGAVEAMSEPTTTPAPTTAPQAQAQAPPPPKPGIYEM